MEPHYLPYEKEIPYGDDVEERLKAMQDIVGGLITESFPFEDDVALISNDDSIRLGMPFNRSVPGGYGGIFGTFFLCGIEEDHFCSLTSEQVEKYKKFFHASELLIGAKGNEPITLKVSSYPKIVPNSDHEKKQCRQSR